MKINKKKVGLVAAAAVAVGLAFIAIVGGPSQAASWIDGQRLKPQSVTSNKIAEGGVGPSEVRNHSLTGTDMNPTTVQRFLKDTIGMTQAEKDAYATKGHANEVAQDAENAAKGYADANDEVGFNTSRAGAGYTQTVPANSIGVVYGKCPADRPLAISGGYRLNGWAAESFSGANQPRVDDVLVLASEPAAYVEGEGLVNSYQHPNFPQTPGGSFQANAHAITIQNDSDTELKVRAWATCIAIN
jgi:hypothetical protein